MDTKITLNNYVFFKNSRLTDGNQYTLTLSEKQKIITIYSYKITLDNFRHFLAAKLRQLCVFLFKLAVWQ